MFKVVIVGSILGIIVMFLYIKYIEKSSIFFPSKELMITPEYIQLPFEDVYITTKDNFKINGWFIPNKNTQYTILFFHGNGGNIGDRLEKIRLLYQLQVNIFIIDYKGYGKSQGSPSEKGLYLDAEGAYNYLVNDRRIRPEHIILYGESLGGTVAAHLASVVDVGALILEGTFSRGRDMAKIFYPFLPSFLFSDRFDSLRKIKKIDAPKLFIHSREDEIVPFKLGKKLYDAAEGQKYLAEIKGGHNTAFLDSQERYLTSLSFFIEGIKTKSLQPSQPNP